MENFEAKKDVPGSPKEPLPALEKAAEKLPPPPKPLSRFARILRIALYSLGGALLIFLAGMLVALVAFTWPARDELKGVGAELKAEQATTQQQKDELKSQADRLAALDAEKKDLQAKLDSGNLHIAILNTLSDVMSARLALADKNDAGARLALSNLAKSLGTLESLVQEDQKAVITALQADLTSAMNILASSPGTVQADLEVMTQNLVQLRDTYFRER